mmetsp:Transcript_106978/g.309447  ORF Transcript_106978/g.309447 Transcript_106978/m.309447 type:complete len:232 (+) Transcript_106978:99-794(+)
MQPAAMPVTPLARMCWRFSDDAAALTKPSSRAAPAAPVAARVDAPEAKVMAAQPCAPAAVESPPSAVADGWRVASYASRDSTGRVWGAPAAYGRGQCVDCPRKAAPPSARCQECQLRAQQVQHPRMPPSDLDAMRAHLDARLAGISDPGLRKDVAQRVAALYQLEAAGHMPAALQASLSTAVAASAAGDRAAAAGMLARIAQEMGRDQDAAQFAMHRPWLMAVRRLLQPSA